MFKVISKKKNTYSVNQEHPKSGKGLVEISISEKDFVFSQSTIISSVSLEKESFLINPDYNKFVNSNGDAFSNESTKANYRSFIGAYNFVNHVQEDTESVGFIADAALRKIVSSADRNSFNYYVDILVATHKQNQDLVSKIIRGNVKFLSMGCEAKFSTCTRCGYVSENSVEECDHIYSSKGKYFIDKFGQRRITAELLGDERPGSVVFLEASWLTEVPAFDGAAIRNLILFPKNSEIRLNMPREALSRPAVQKYLDL